jgi:hypothetical protein
LSASDANALTGDVASKAWTWLNVAARPMTSEQVLAM